ncbi:PCYCGC motif-containing (lipo)protein [Peribacillus glennii]|uniref:Lipoprotein n=1 Tax=Peribacillus glennii TaxID=2303991 RepID=A0A372LDD1_9BACI|nr:PCYCGC motif-containing (lipo)protein [Peribacillus glennii]RFU63753.1 hypothetical protein D0466_09790 [Peribacillus glennii]
MKLKYTFLLALIIALLTACSNPSETAESSKKEANKEGHTEHTKENAAAETQSHTHGDIREETANADILPKFLNDKEDDMKTIYLAAAKSRDLLEKIPCYCGCGEEAGHKNNYDCFVFENKKDGKVVWDDHGTKCGVCLQIAAQSVIDLQNGKSVKEIRDAIDKKYEKGFAKPTPTPGV